MKLQEHIPLASLTTFHIGGEARYFIRAENEQDIIDAIAFAREHTLPMHILGAGSNVLISDEEITGVVVQCAIQGVELEESDESVLIHAGAGERWDTIVDCAVQHGFYGVENLAGIPGTMAGAAVQNIGAYGAEFSDVFYSAETIYRATGERRVVSQREASFAYRTSIFKQEQTYIITRVTLELQKKALPNLGYADVARAQREGVPLTTPREIAEAIRAIRALKFPQRSDEGTAGSFFKNPVLTPEQYSTLTKTYPDLPGFMQTDGSIKISLAWLLDHVLGLKGFTLGQMRLYEKQPLVIVASEGARASTVDAFATEIATRVFSATNIVIEREVEMFGVKNKTR